VGIVASAVWPQAVLLPALILVLAGAAWLSVGLSVLALLAATTVAHAASLLVTEVKFRHIFHSLPRTSEPAHVDFRIRAALPFIGLAGLALLNTRVDILVLSGLSTSSETGVYSVATRIADVLLLPITVVNMVVSPTVAKLYRSGNLSELQNLLKRSSRFSLLLTGLPAVVLIAFGGPIITTCFGAAYSGAANPLRVLALAQIINASAGGVGMALSMTGHERSALRVGIMAAALNLFLNLILVPLAGGMGAAIGTAISLVAWRAGFYWVVRRRLGIRPTAFGA
jgi:O-antigen/teichoic acid export membrane protein